MIFKYIGGGDSSLFFFNESYCIYLESLDAISHYGIKPQYVKVYQDCNMYIKEGRLHEWRDNVEFIYLEKDVIGFVRVKEYLILNFRVDLYQIREFHVYFQRQLINKFISSSYFISYLDEQIFYCELVKDEYLLVKQSLLNSDTKYISLAKYYLNQNLKKIDIKYNSPTIKILDSHIYILFANVFLLFDLDLNYLDELIVNFESKNNLVYSEYNNSFVYCNGRKMIEFTLWESGKFRSCDVRSLNLQENLVVRSGSSFVFKKYNIFCTDLKERVLFIYDMEEYRIVEAHPIDDAINVPLLYKYYNGILYLLMSQKVMYLFKYLNNGS